MNNARFSRFVPGRKRLIQKSFGALRVFCRHSGFHFAGERPNFASDLEVVLGVGLRLTMRFERRSMTSCL